MAALLCLVLGACGSSSGSGSSTSSNAAVASATTTPPSTTPATTPSSTTGAAKKKAPSSTAAKKPSTTSTAKAPKPKAAPKLLIPAKKTPTVDPKKLAKLNAAVAALRACMRRQGMTTPKSSGTSQAAYEAALRRCIPALKINLPSATKPSSETKTKSLAKFVACMRSNGVNLPAPKSTSGGPVLNTEGVDTTSAQFKQALAKCKGDLGGLSELIGGAIGTNAGSASSG